ncbi:hypothetical protein ACFV0B_05640 [Streptomyces xanthophaeus]|uniref:hypothetical protein n=1 Tax=Streptomyces xanthophaeus TaxID=67385 RepID=UPI0036BC7BAE
MRDAPRPAALTCGFEEKYGYARSVPAVLIGSDGGGIRFAVAADGAVRRSRAASDEGGFDRIAAGLPEFLDLLRRSVHRFNRTGEPGFV